MLLAQFSNSITVDKEHKVEIAQVKSGISLMSNYLIVQKNKVYKYTKPFNIVKPTSPFGYRELLNPFTGGVTTGSHMGIDIVGNWHCEVSSIADGVVLDVWPVPNWYYKGHELFGGYIRIEHADGWISGYGHLSSIYVKEGDVLKDGLFYRNGKLLPSKGVMGRQGNTGMSTGEHLHLSIQDAEGEFVDPLEYLEL